MDYNKGMFWLQACFAVINAGVWLYVWRSRQSMATNTKIEGLERDMDMRIASNTDRLSRLEVGQTTAPSHDDLKRIHQRMDSVGGSLKHLTGQFDGVKHTLDLIHEYLLNNKGHP